MDDALKSGIKKATKAWESIGSDLGKLYHGGKKKIRSVDFDKTQQRDSGFYGQGFYTTTNKEWAKTYGKVVSEIQINPNARVLNVNSLSPKNAPEGLIDDIIAHKYNKGKGVAAERGRLKEFREELEDIRNNHVAYTHAIDGYARDNGYDIVKYSDGEVVLLNKNAIKDPSEDVAALLPAIMSTNIPSPEQEAVQPAFNPIESIALGPGNLAADIVFELLSRMPSKQYPPIKGMPEMP